MKPEWQKEVMDGIAEWFPDDPKYADMFRPAEIRGILYDAFEKPFWTLSITRQGLEVSFGSNDLLAPAALGITYLPDLIDDLIALHSSGDGRVDQATLAAAAAEFETYAAQLRTVIRERGADLGGFGE